eukprot:Amastigsp_a518011_44.p2 type:complete len:131 gc:universal Amastigsp_a518011_44:202-594(+)
MAARARAEHAHRRPREHQQPHRGQGRRAGVSGRRSRVAAGLVLAAHSRALEQAAACNAAASPALHSQHVALEREHNACAASHTTQPRLLRAQCPAVVLGARCNASLPHEVRDSGLRVHGRACASRSGRRL